jgi:mercuric reductase
MGEEMGELTTEMTATETSCSDGACESSIDVPESGDSDAPGGYDLAVLGAGSAGFAAAIRAVDSGSRVVLVQSGTLGGTCVNVGCVPSKTLIRAAEAIRHQRVHPFEGIDTREPSVDWSAVRAGKDDLVDALRKAKYEDVLAGYPEITLVEGRGVFDTEGRLHLEDGTPIPAKATIVSTGSSPWAPEVPGLAEAGYLDSTALLDIENLPQTLAVLGAGSVGLELAQAYARFGVQVTILVRSRVLSKQDPEVSAELTGHLRDEGMTVLAGVAIEEVVRTESGRRIDYRAEDGTAGSLDVEEILIASGRRANTSHMGLAEAGVELGPRGELLVDAGQRSSNPRIFAAGDVTGGPMHVYVAAQAGQIAATNALGGDDALDLSVLPAVVFTDPAVATVGMTEAEAREAGIEPIVSTLPLEHVPRALAARDTRGFVKLVADADTRKIIGAQVVAPEAGEMIMEPALAIRFGLTVEDLTSMLHPYLTLSEGIKLAALTFDKDVATLSCCAV